jgi:hypothetical protein
MLLQNCRLERFFFFPFFFFFFFPSSSLFVSDSEKQGSIALQSVAEIRLAEGELHVVARSGRVYMLRLVAGADSEELLRVSTHWQQWLAYVRSFLPSAAPSSSAQRVPSLSLTLSDTSSSQLSSPPSPGAAAVETALASSGSSLRGMNKDSPRKDVLSPRKLVAEVRSRLGTSSSKNLGKGKAAAAASSSPPDSGGELAMAMEFSLLQSLQPMMLLFFVLTEDSLIGFADETREEAVEEIGLESVKTASASGEKRWELQLRNGENMYFGCARGAERWVEAIRGRLVSESELADEELEEPELGSCGLDMEFEEDDAAAPSSIRRASMMLHAQIEKIELPCPVCGTGNPRDSARCSECGSSDGYGKMVPPAVPPKPKRRPPPPPPK